MNEAIYFQNGNDKNNADIWDDLLLIKAYNESLKLCKEDVAKNIARATNGKRNINNSESESSISEVNNEPTELMWKVGDFVRAMYTDGIDYEAEIVSFDTANNTCTLKYIGYGNVQEVSVNDLLPSWGKKARKKQMHEVTNVCVDDVPVTVNVTATKSTKKSRKTSTAASNETARLFSRIPGMSKCIPPVLPPMPPMLEPLSEDSEHLSAMLMSWYMSGYYTGLYNGRKLAQQQLQQQQQQPSQQPQQSQHLQQSQQQQSIPKNKK